MKMKRIGPDPALVKQVSEVLRQNARVLQMNAEIIRAIMAPPYVVDSDVKIDINRLMPGDIRRS